ncbi:hypothetical protein KIK84_03280 [Curvibacter sp. CHRR-16]|uniref:hypothetical protein n=1 Tax=Curvibacter sp. CHRR-16 TaxID=2835872 RepID=UPI001BDB468B|nr:hypothetical protein [Curvibacter sp. CHRR-16]MBT0569334.1 hypothetical protein [Curvibacter sp. CHRR-16]
MYTNEDLQSAVQAGVLTQESVDAFRAHMAQQQSTTLVDEEQFRLVSGFNDVFVVIACALLLVAVGWIGHGVSLSVAGGAVALIAWGLAEFFVRKRHMALPAIVLLGAYVGGFVMAMYPVMDAGHALASVVCMLLLTAGVWLHWRRFYVPITVALGAAAMVFMALKTLDGVLHIFTNSWSMVLISLAGVCVFASALWWDSRDVLRKTRRSDVAFWLHLLAAPLLVHPAFWQLMRKLEQSGDAMSLPSAALVLAVYVVLAVVSLVIDRRALMVSALAYVLYTFSAVFKQYGEPSLSFAFTALTIGSGLLLLSAFWHSCRSRILPHMPAVIQGWVPPLK